jgi:hypothetical protein
MDNKFEIISIPASDIKINIELEGIIPKTWIETQRFGKVLFKEAASKRNLIAESRTDWSEKIVSEINQLVKLPTAQYELAVIVDGNDKVPGTLSIDLSQPGDEERFPLQELLQQSIARYDYAFDYEVENVIQALSDNNIGLPPNSLVPEGINDGADMFVGILMMDATVGNSDRHDRNLDIVRQSDGQSYLSPVFDQGYSLGAVEDNDLRSWISPQQYNTHHNFSSFSYEGEDISGLEAFKQAAKLRPEAAKIWLNELQKIDDRQIEQIFKRVPEPTLTRDTSNFAKNLLRHNRSQLLSLNLNYQQDINLNSQNSSSQTPALDTSKPIEDIQFEMASSAKYITFKEGKDIFNSSDGITIEKEKPQNLLIRYEGKLIKFDRDFEVISNEFSERELRQLNQKVQFNKQQLQKHSQNQQPSQDRGLSL